MAGLSPLLLPRARQHSLQFSVAPWGIHRLGQIGTSEAVGSWSLDPFCGAKGWKDCFQRGSGLGGFPELICSQPQRISEIMLFALCSD